MAKRTITVEEDNQRLRACLAVAWGWMIAKGADEAALEAVGFIEITAAEPENPGRPFGSDNI